MTTMVHADDGDDKARFSEARTGALRYAANRVAAHKASWSTALGKHGRVVAAVRGYASPDFRNVRREREAEYPDRFPPALKVEMELVALWEAGQELALVLAPVQEILARFGYVAVPSYMRSAYRERWP